MSKTLLALLLTTGIGLGSEEYQCRYFSYADKFANIHKILYDKDIKQTFKIANNKVTMDAKVAKYEFTYNRESVLKDGISYTVYINKHDELLVVYGKDWSRGVKFISDSTQIDLVDCMAVNFSDVGKRV